MSDFYTATELLERIENNDNRYTAQPYLLLLQKKRMHVVPEGFGCNTEKKFVERVSGDYATFKTEEECIAWLKEDRDEDYEPKEGEQYDEYYEDYTWETENVFLTDEGYKDHFKVNAHNLIEHRTYGIHAFRNKEIKSLFALIKSQAKLEAENKELKEREEVILNYCEDYTDNMWAAKIVSIILDCDFRDAKTEVRKALEKLKELK